MSRCQLSSPISPQAPFLTLEGKPTLIVVILVPGISIQHLKYLDDVGVRLIASEFVSSAVKTQNETIA